MLVLPLAIPSEKGLQKHTMLLLPSLGAYKSQLLQKKNRPNIRMAGANGKKYKRVPKTKIQNSKKRPRQNQGKLFRPKGRLPLSVLERLRSRYLYRSRHTYTNKETSETPRRL